MNSAALENGFRDLQCLAMGGNIVRANDPRTAAKCCYRNDQRPCNAIGWAVLPSHSAYETLAACADNDGESE